LAVPANASQALHLLRRSVSNLAAAMFCLDSLIKIEISSELTRQVSQEELPKTLWLRTQPYFVSTLPCVTHDYFPSTFLSQRHMPA
jgi:hypothetical protein